jgi:chromosome segregation ATPase
MAVHTTPQVKMPATYLHPASFSSSHSGLPAIPEAEETPQTSAPRQAGTHTPGPHARAGARTRALRNIAGQDWPGATAGTRLSSAATQGRADDPDPGVALLQTRIAGLEKRIAGLNKAIADFTSPRPKSVTVAATMRAPTPGNSASMLRAAEEHIEDLSHDNACLRQLLTNLGPVGADADERARQAWDGLKSVREKHAGALNALNEHISRLTGEIQALEERLRTCEGDLAAARSDKALAKVLHTLQLGEVQGERASAEAEVVNLRQSLAKVKDDAAWLDAELSASADRYAHLHDFAATLGQRATEIQGEGAKLQRVLEDLNERYGKLHEAHAALTAEHGGLIDERDELKVAEASAAEEIDDLKRQIDAVLERNDRLESKLAALACHTLADGQANTALATRNSALEKLIPALQAQRNAVAADRDQKAAENDRLTAENARLAQQVADLERLLAAQDSPAR